MIMIVHSSSLGQKTKKYQGSMASSLGQKTKKYQGSMYRVAFLKSYRIATLFTNIALCLA